MKVDHRKIEVEIFPDETEELRRILPYWRGNSGGCAGLYTQHPSDPDNGDEQHMIVAIRGSQLNDPVSLVATVAHELGHEIQSRLTGGSFCPPTGCPYNGNGGMIGLPEMKWRPDIWMGSLRPGRACSRVGMTAAFLNRAMTTVCGRPRSVSSFSDISMRSDCEA